MPDAFDIARLVFETLRQRISLKGDTMQLCFEQSLLIKDNKHENRECNSTTYEINSESQEKNTNCQQALKNKRFKVSLINFWASIKADFGS